MLQWLWCVVSFIFGEFVGILVVALLTANGDDNDNS